MSMLVTPFESSDVESATTLTVQDAKISQVISEERLRLRRFIARYVGDRIEVDDILQDVLSELVAAYRLMKPIEQVGSWLVRVARNRIIDRFRKHQPEPLPYESFIDSEGELFTWDEFLPDAAAGPDEALMREAMLEQIERALATLTPIQRDVFVAHELEGQSFKEMSQQWGIGISTLLSRKHEAVLALRKQLQRVFDELT